jgi:hypothetical protein
LASVEAQAQYIIKEIVSWDDYAAAITHSKNESDSKWASARLSVHLQEEIGDELDKSAIRAAVGELYGVAAATIRRREKAARYIPKEFSDKWPGIAFTHWRAAVDYKGTNDMYAEDPYGGAVDIIYQMVEYKQDPDRGAGSYPSVATVDGWVYGDDGKAAMVWRSRLSGVDDQMGKIFHDKHTPFILRTIIGYSRSLIQYWSDTGENPLAKRSEGTDMRDK